MAAALVAPQTLLAGVANAAEAPTTVYAAVSLKDVLETYARSNATKVRFSFGASSTLARQIAQGAPADVFLSADREWMDFLERNNALVKTSRIALSSNRLVVIAPASQSAMLDIRDATAWTTRIGQSRVVLADPRHVPAGRYAKEGLAKLGVWNVIEKRGAFADNVRVALAMVAREQAPLGIVYASDALAEPRVRVVAEIDSKLHAQIVYEAALLRRANAQATQWLQQFMQSAPALFEQFGFVNLTNTK